MYYNVLQCTTALLQSKIMHLSVCMAIVYLSNKHLDIIIVV